MIMIILLTFSVLKGRLRSNFIISKSRSYVSYVQGQYTSPKTREYFYYIDHQGQLFLDDTKVKNFITCFKDKKFLAFFFKRLKLNSTGRYMNDFPYVSPCGPETNYIRCEDLPIVFTHLLDQDRQVIQDIATYGNESESSTTWLSYCGCGDLLLHPFSPQTLYMATDTGRIYHKGAGKVGGAGLIKSSLAIELSNFFTYSMNKTETGKTGPTGFNWRGTQYQLNPSLQI